MKKINPTSILLVVAISSLLVIQGIYSYITKKTESLENTLTVTQEATCTVIHEFMDLNGTTYSEHSRNTIENLVIGDTITPPVLDVEGFEAPQVQSVTIDKFSNTVTYRYIRKQYTLTINNSTYVTTTTPSGTYYYGQTIHLVANATDGNGNPFVKWSNNETNPDYTFQLTKNTTIKPLYAETYTITYVPNNGNSSFTEEVIQTEPINTFPDVEYNDCSGGTGTYEQQGCTYVYKLLGWYKDSNFTNKVDESFVPTEDTTLYAKWNKVYFRNDGPVVFDGDDIIYTDVFLYNAENANKDFIVTFTVDDYMGYNPTNNKDKRATIFQDMNEHDPYLGVQFFHDYNSYYVNVNSSANNADRVKDPNTGYKTRQKVILKRENGIVSYSYDDGLTFTSTVNFSNFTAYFDYPATFGAGLDANKNPWRYLIGTLSDMSVEIIEPPTYTIHYDANGGTGSMNNQEFTYNDPAEPLTANTFTRTNYVFKGWNTAADGSGTHYDNEEEVRNLSNIDDDVVTLYAEWWKIEFIRTGDVVFDGTANTFIDTGLNIFSLTNIDKDFEIRFTFKSVDSDQMQYITGKQKQPTIFNAKDESNSTYPGMNVRFSGNITTITPTYRWGGSTTNVGNIAVSNKPIEFIYRRKSNNNNEKIITIEYKYNNYDSGERTTINQSSWSLNQPFATNVAFGGYFDGSNQPGRFFKGTLADISIIMEE